jgi:glycolate oxidase FAD binding subunit
VKTVHASSTAEVAEVLRDASAAGLAVVPRGGGTKFDWGNQPSTVDIVLDLRDLRGPSEHAPADLVATVGAGTPLADLQAALAPAGQRLSVEVGSAGATVGGMLATNEGGPLRVRHGTGRDLLIGVEFVRADGVIARSGGRVVKNVAGYDVGKLLCGSYGTLGVITSATFRLHPVPAARVWVSRTVQTPQDVHSLVGVLIESTVDPAAVEVDLPALGAGTLAVLIEGTPGGVAKRAEACRELLEGEVSTLDEPPLWWNTYPFEPGDVALELVAPVDALHAAVYALHDAAGAAVPVRGSAGAGVVYATLPGSLPAGPVAAIVDAVRDVLLARDGSCVVLSLPPALRGAVDQWGPLSGLDLMRRVKEQFDPSRTLSPGRFVGGI